MKIIGNMILYGASNKAGYACEILGDATKPVIKQNRIIIISFIIC